MSSSSITSPDLLIGYVSLFISCAAFGFMFAPLRKYDARDGVFVQWVQCSVVFLAGCAVNIAQGYPAFNPIASIGGFLYASGNVASVPIVAEMGIGLGMLIWGSVQIVVGWCVARFGLFGTKIQQVQNPLLNYLGVILTLLSGLMFVFVYGEGGEEERERAVKEHTTSIPLSQRTTTVANGEESIRYGSMRVTTNAEIEQGNSTQILHPPTDSNYPENEPSQKKTARTSLWHLTGRKFFFIGLALCLGSLHGLMLTPIVYVQDNDPNASKNVLDYVFSHFTAVYFFSSLYFFIYSFIKRGKPFIKAELILPSIAYGILWTIGMILFIVSNRLLSQTVSFPITVRLPAIIGAMADVFLFRSVHGKRRLTYMFAAILIGFLGVILVGISL